MSEEIEKFRKFLNWLNDLKAENIDELIERMERIDSNSFEEKASEASHYTWLDDQNEKLKSENDRLNKFCNEFVYGEENPKYYKTMDEKIDELKTENEKLKEALRKIRDTDYRGNRSIESQIAYTVLKEVEGEK